MSAENLNPTEGTFPINSGIAEAAIRDIILAPKRGLYSAVPEESKITQTKHYPLKALIALRAGLLSKSQRFDESLLISSGYAQGAFTFLRAYRMKAYKPGTFTSITSETITSMMIDRRIPEGDISLFQDLQKQSLESFDLNHLRLKLDEKGGIFPTQYELTEKVPGRMRKMMEKEIGFKTAWEKVFGNMALPANSPYRSHAECGLTDMYEAVMMNEERRRFEGIMNIPNEEDVRILKILEGMFNTPTNACDDLSYEQRKRNPNSGE